MVACWSESSGSEAYVLGNKYDNRVHGEQCWGFCVGLLLLFFFGGGLDPNCPQQ